MSLVQFMSDMSRHRHDSLALHIRHTQILQPHQERLEKSVFSDSFKKCCILLHGCKCYWPKPFKDTDTFKEK